MSVFMSNYIYVSFMNTEFSKNQREYSETQLAMWNLQWSILYFTVTCKLCAKHLLHK